MSSWQFGTTADVGMRCYSVSENRLLEEAVSGMQSILLSPKGKKILQTLTRDTGSFMITSESDQWSSILVLLLEEVLFRAEAKDEWICDLQIITELTESGITANIQYSKVKNINFFFNHRVICDFAIISLNHFWIPFLTYFGHPFGTPLGPLGTLGP